MTRIEVYKENYQRRQARLWAERERQRQQTLAAVIPQLQTVARRHGRQISRLFLFGSLVRPGHFMSASDIDVAVEWREKGDYFALWRELEEAVGREIDLRELGDDLFSQRVRESGMLIYESGSD